MRDDGSSVTVNVIPAGRSTDVVRARRKKSAAALRTSFLMPTSTHLTSRLMRCAESATGGKLESLNRAHAHAGHEHAYARTHVHTVAHILNELVSVAPVKYVKQRLRSIPMTSPAADNRTRMRRHGPCSAVSSSLTVLMDVKVFVSHSLRLLRRCPSRSDRI
jgi:hypothetical protein